MQKNIDEMQKGIGFDVVIICTSTVHQANYWEKRLTATRGTVAASDALVLAVDEDWNSGGAGNGLGTLYAFQKAAIAAKTKSNRDIAEELGANAISVAIYHTAGKGTRLAPLPGAENNNKPGVKLSGTLSVDGNTLPITILECVIKQTGTYAPCRKGRLSTFWGDQVFVPSTEVSYKPTAHADILAALGPMPSEEEWVAKEMHKYGLIAVNAQGQGAQVEKVDYGTATTLLKDLGEVTQVGTSLGSFSISSELLQALLLEFKPELEAKSAAMDTDPHFWMPMTLPESGYIQIMQTKGMSEDDARAHFARVQKLITSLSPTLNQFSGVPVGMGGYWWDYGQLKLYRQNNLLVTGTSEEAAALRGFLGIEETAKTAGSSISSSVAVDAQSCALGCTISGSGRVDASVLTNVASKDVDVTGSILVNVAAPSIKAKNCIIYNVNDTSALELKDNTVLVGMITPSGERLLMRSDYNTDGKETWKTPVFDNPHSWEGAYKLNADADVSSIEIEFQKDRAAVIAAL